MIDWACAPARPLLRPSFHRFCPPSNGKTALSPPLGAFCGISAAGVAGFRRYSGVNSGEVPADAGESRAGPILPRISAHRPDRGVRVKKDARKAQVAESYCTETATCCEL
jgi:hypothetical protein